MQDAAIQTVLRRILILNLGVAFAKLGIGLLTGAISIVADGFHSLIDGLSNVVALLAQWIAAQPPDEDHPYGHRRFEAIATFIIGGFLLLAAWETLQAAGQRLINGGTPEVIPLSFGVLLVTLVVNIGVVLYERRAAQQYNSRILLADANHTFTDVIVTCSVIVGLVLVQLGLPQADALVALIIVAVIVRMGWSIMAESVKILVDAAPLTAQQLGTVALTVPSVDNVLQARSRGTGHDVLVDLEIQVDPNITTDQAQNIRQAVQEAIQVQYPQTSEVQITFAPQQDKPPSYIQRVRAAADGLGLGVHEVIPIPSAGGLTLEMHVEVQRGLSLHMAHDLVSRLERKLLGDSDIHGIVTHIEPRSGHGAPLIHTHTALKLRDDALAIAHRLYDDADWHDGTIRLALGGYALTMHCHLPGQISVEEAHQIAEHVETQIRAELSQIQRVTIHTEPRDTPTSTLD